MPNPPPTEAPDRVLVPGALLLAWAVALPTIMVFGFREPWVSLRALALGALPAALFVFLRRRGWRRLAWLLLVPTVLAGSFDVLLLQLFGHRLTPQVLFVIFETNPREALEFVQMYLGPGLLVPLAVLGVAVPAGLGLARLPGARILGLVACLGGLLAVGKGCSLQDFPPLAWLLALEDYRVETAAYRSLRDQLPEAGVGAAHPPGDTLDVLILGESTGRNHMGIYGYPRATTPRLAAMGDELLVFKDAVSHQSHTQAAMKELLTFFDQESTRPWNEYPTLLGALRAAGYETWWISNQEMYGLWANVGGALASQADVKLFHKHRSSEGTETQPVFVTTRDEDLVPYVARVAALPPDRARFLVVHLMGTHGWYGNRFPPGFARFDGTVMPDPDRPWLTPAKRRAIDLYDDAVLYNDEVVARIMETVAAAGRRGFVLYLSDHGEEVYDGRDFLGHTDQVGTRYMIEVPLLLWLSPAFRAAEAARSAAAAAARDLPFMTDDLPHLLLDLAGVAAPGFEASRSPLSPAYRRDRPRTYAGKDYDCELREPPRAGCGPGPGTGATP